MRERSRLALGPGLAAAPRATATVGRRGRRRAGRGLARRRDRHRLRMADDHGPENLVAGRDPHAVFATVGQSDNARPRHAFRCVDFAGRDLLVPHAFAARERPRAIGEPHQRTNDGNDQKSAPCAMGCRRRAGRGTGRRSCRQPLGRYGPGAGLHGLGRAIARGTPGARFGAASQRCILVVRDDGPRGAGRACL